MSSYCANNPDTCDEYANEYYNKSFSELNDEEREYLCKRCCDDRIDYADTCDEQEKYKGL